MEVAAACLNAAMRMRPDPEWVPPVGELFVRAHFAPWRDEIEFCYAEQVFPDGGVHLQNIARIANWRGEPYFGGGVELARGDVYICGAGTAIIRRLADEDDVRALVKLWDGDNKHRGAMRCTPEEWLARVRETSLAESSKAMIARALGIGLESGDV